MTTIDKIKNMNSTIELQKKMLSPPGDTIQETLEMMGMSQVELAERIGRPKEKVNDLIKGRELISTDTAFRLETVLGIPASFWINREKQYRKKIYEIELQEKLAFQQDWLEKFPLKEMKKLGWLPNVADKSVLVSELLKFFGIASPQEWHRIYISKEASVVFRISLANTKNPYAMSTWLRKAEIDANKLEVADFDKTKFRSALKDIKNGLDNFSTEAIKKLQKICAECGVALICVPPLPEAPINAASRWFQGKPIIQLPDNYQTDNHFWFTFYHEAGHILLHGKKDVFLENVAGIEMNKSKEEVADAFAAKHLSKILISK